MDGEIVSKAWLEEFQRLGDEFKEAEEALTKKQSTFIYEYPGESCLKVELCGSFDDWETKYDMEYNPLSNQWYVTLNLEIGEEYLYKYIVYDENFASEWVVNENEPKK